MASFSESFTTGKLTCNHGGIRSKKRIRRRKTSFRASLNFTKTNSFADGLTHFRLGYWRSDRVKTLRHCPPRCQASWKTEWSRCGRRRRLPLGNIPYVIKPFATCSQHRSTVSKPPTLHLTPRPFLYIHTYHGRSCRRVLSNRFTTSSGLPTSG